MPARSKSQQRLFGMLHAYNKGELQGSKPLKRRMSEMSKHISDEDARHFATTPHADLPEKRGSSDTSNDTFEKRPIGEDVMISRLRKQALLKIAVGAVSAAPLSAFHTVAKGDTLSSLAKQYGTTVQALQTANNLSNPSLIRMGQKLTLPKPTEAVPAVGLNAVSNVLHRKFNRPDLEAGILANIDRETGGTFDYRIWEGRRKQTFDPRKKQKGGYGLFQLTGPNLTAYKNWLTHSKRTDSADSQIDFVSSKYGPTRDGWKRHVGNRSNLTKEQYADWWHRFVETPGYSISGGEHYDEAMFNRMTNKHNVFLKNLRRSNGAWTR